ncbi:TIR domain-containing protein [Vibrio fluvialis]
MKDRIEELLTISQKCKEASTQFESSGFDKETFALEEVIRKVERASSNSWLGYQANVYYVDFNIPKPGDHFSKEWGLKDTFVNRVSDNWIEYNPENVKEYIFEKSGVSENTKFAEVAYQTGKLFDSMKDELSSLLTILLEDTKSEVIEGYRDEVKKIESHFSQQSLLQAAKPRGQFISRDSLAMSQGFIAPPHITVKSWLYSLKSYFSQIEELSKFAERTATYLRQKYREKVPEKIIHGKVFVGHGRSPIWRDLSHFLSDRLKLEWDEFNREATAGLSIKERLETMLDQASFAFLIMTAEDEHADSTLHARENVIHEVGLFQGRLTFKRAIVLLEDGCQEFSNIHGVGQIRFPKGNIKAAFEDIRMVLEREGLIEP